MAKKNELAVVEGFQIAKRYEGMDPELLAEIQDELEDLDPEAGIACRKIKIPAGGGLAYEIQGEDEDDAEYKKTIPAVIVFTHRMNAYWSASYGDNQSEQNRLPDCSSMDGKTGLNSNTGEVISCERCPFNQYGSGVDQQGRQSRGKACKNMRRLYLMMSGDPNFYLLTVPPTSIRDVNKQLQRILAGGVPYTGLVCNFTLEKTKNAAGTDYSKVVASKGGILPPELVAQAIAMRSEIKKQYKDMAITAEDYAAAPANAASATATPANGANGGAAAPDFEEAPPYEEAEPQGRDAAPPPDDEDLPF